MKENIVEVFPNFPIDMRLLVKQRKVLYRIQDTFRRKDIVSGIGGVIELLHCIEEYWNEQSGHNARLRRRIEKCKQRRLACRKKSS